VNVPLLFGEPTRLSKRLQGAWEVADAELRYGT
jgi:hypothetical protein